MIFGSNQPIYMQIGDYICENIMKKTWAEGSKIPSVREMAVDTQVNPNTVMRTYSHLQELGIIFNQRGIGYFIAEEAYSNTRKIKTIEFIESDLPIIFKKMDLLNMDIKDLENYYKEYSATAGNGGI